MAAVVNPKAVRHSLKSLASQVGSALIGFVAAGSGAVVRDAQGKLRECVSVLDYLPVSEHAAILAKTSTYDCTAGLRKAIAASKNLYWPGGLYLVTPVGGADPAAGPALDLNQLTDVFWSGYGATIKSTDNSIATGYSWMLRMRLNTNVVIEGLTFDGNRDNRPAPFNSASHCITMLGGSYHVFRDVTINNSTYDGILIWPNNAGIYEQYPNHILLDNVVVNNAYRNGVSITGGYAVEIRGGSFTESNGTLPMAGIDIESDPADEFSVKDVLIDGSVFSDNEGYGLICTGNVPPAGYRTENIVISNISGRGNGDGFMHISRVDNCIVNGLSISDETVDPSSGLGLVYVDPTSLSVHLSKLSFKNITGVTKPCIYVQNGAGEPTIIENVRCSDISNPTLSINSEAHINGVYVDGDGSAENTILLHGLADYSTLRNVSIKGKAAGVPIRAQADYATLENIKLLEVVNGVRMEGTNNKYRNIDVVLNGTAASYAYFMDTATGVSIANLTAKDTGGFWTNATAFSFDAGLTSLAGARIRNVFPSPLMGSATWDPGSIANGASATTTVAVTRADIGDAVLHGHNVSLAGLTSSAYVSAANTVTVVLSNTTGGAVDLASHTVTVEVVK